MSKITNLMFVLYSTQCYNEYKKLKSILFGLVYNAEFILRDKILYVSLNNGCYRYYIKDKVLRYTANSWYDDINTDNL